MNEVEFYKELYRSADVGHDAVERLMPKVQDEHLRHDMALHMEGYRHFGGIARGELRRVREEARRDSPLKQLPAHIGMAMHTLFDRSSSHIAELMINGSYMSILDMRKHLNRLREQKGTEDAAILCQRMIDFEEDNVKRMQNYI